MNYLKVQHCSLKTKKVVTKHCVVYSDGAVVNCGSKKSCYLTIDKYTELQNDILSRLPEQPTRPSSTRIEPTDQTTSEDEERSGSDNSSRQLDTFVEAFSEYKRKAAECKRKAAEAGKKADEGFDRVFRGLESIRDNAQSRVRLAAASECIEITRNYLEPETVDVTVITTV